MRQLVGIVLFQIMFTLKAGSQILPFHNYTTKDGLLSNRILTITQDSRGYLWIGTADGVSVFDGVSFKNYTVADGLSGSYVTRMLESKMNPGTMWVATLDGGLSKFERNTFRRVVLDSPSRRAVSLMEKDGVLWCGTDGPILQLHGDTIIHFARDELPQDEAEIAEGDDGTVYILYKNALYLCRSGTSHPRLFDLRLQHGASFLGLSPGRDGEVWIGSTDGMVFCFRNSILRQQCFVGAGRTYPIVVDADDAMWMGAMYRIPRNRLASGEFIHYTKENGLPEGNVYPLNVDRENNVWFGSWDNGVVKLSEKDIIRFPAPLHDSKNAVIVDDAGRLWGLAWDGVHEFWKDSTQSWHTRRHVMRSASGSVLNGSHGIFAYGHLWMTCNDGAVRGYQIQRRGSHEASSLTMRWLLPFQEEHDGKLIGMHADRSKRLWCVVGNSLVVIDVRTSPRIIRRIASPLLPRNVFVNALWEDRRGNIWIGDYSLGLFLLPGDAGMRDTIVHFTQRDGIPSGGIRSIIEDNTGRIWVGTRYGGVAVFDDGSFTTISTQNGVLSNHVRSMARDSTGMMWLGTSLGPMFVEGRDMKHMGWNNELLGTQVNACGVHPAGFLWFATSTGLALYDHSRHRVNTYAPPAYITSFDVNGEALELASPLTLPHDRNTCVINFIGVSLRDPASVRYRYRLVGVDSVWSAPTAQRSVTFAALRPGSYRFEVLAFNADGVQSVAPAVLSFTIHPPFYQRWWFIGGVAVVVLTAFAGVVRYVSTQRLQRKVQMLEKERAVQLERERTRERIARDLHDDVASTLGSVVIYTESLKRQLEQTGQSAELAERIGSLSQEAQEAIGDIVWSTSPTHDSLKELLTRIRDIGSEMCTARSMSYRITIPPEIPAVALQDEVRKNILLIFKEAMNNIVKHSHATSVEIAATLADGKLRLVIADNGRGMPEQPGDSTARGHGLRNMARRAEEIGAQLHIRSRPGEGTRVEITCEMT